MELICTRRDPSKLIPHDNCSVSCTTHCVTKTKNGLRNPRQPLYATNCRTIHVPVICIAIASALTPEPGDTTRAKFHASSPEPSPPNAVLYLFKVNIGVTQATRKTRLFPNVNNAPRGMRFLHNNAFKALRVGVANNHLVFINRQLDDSLLLLKASTRCIPLRPLYVHTVYGVDTFGRTVFTNLT